MRKLTILLAFFIFSFNLNAQWAKTYGGSEDDYPSSILQTSDGGYIIFGETKSFGFRNRYSDVWILKLNTLGEIEWQKTYGNQAGNPAYSIQKTNDGGYIFECLMSVTGDITIIKLSSKGDIEWKKDYGDNSVNKSYSLRQTVDGGYIIAGTNWFPDTGTHDVIILKLFFDGTVEWSMTYVASGDDNPSSIHQTFDGGYIVAGDTDSYGAGSSDIWILKIASDGNIVWQKTYGGGQNEEVSSIQQTNDGGFIVLGKTTSFGTGQLDFLVLKLSSEGNIKWNKTYGGSKHDAGYCIQQTFDGSYMVAGYTNSYGAGMADIWILKLSSDGNIIWQKTYGGARNEEASFIQQTHDGGYIVAGSTDTYGVGERDILILKLFPNGDINSSCVFVQESSSEDFPTDISSADSYMDSDYFDILLHDMEITTQESAAVVYSLCSGQHTLSITTSSGGTSEPPPGTYIYDHAERTSISANPDDGYNFILWSGDVQSSDKSLSITMDSDKSAKANFSENIVDDLIEEAKNAPCFIATAAFGSPLHPYVRTLQDFRDKYLLSSKPGHTIVRLYYKYSPHIAELITNHKALRTVVRIWLVPFVALGYSMVHFGAVKTSLMLVLTFMPLFVFFWLFRRRGK